MLLLLAPLQSDDSLLHSSAWPAVNMSMAVLDWVQTKLQGLTLVQLDTAVDVHSGIIMAGHSRGGKVAMAVAANVTQALKPGAVRGVILLDPVDAGWTPYGPSQTEPKLLCIKKDKGAACPFSTAQTAPVLVVGTGLGALHKCPSGPNTTDACCSCPLWGACGSACAPPPFAAASFFQQLASANVTLFNAPTFGHMDLLDDQPLVSKVCLHCRDPQQRQLFKSFLGGVAVAFVRANVARVPDEKFVAVWRALRKPCDRCPAHANITLTHQGKLVPPPAAQLVLPSGQGAASTGGVTGAEEAVL